MTDYEKFCAEFNDLSIRDKVALYRDYQREVDDEEEWYDFEEEFFELFFAGNPIEAIRAWHFGSDDNSWSDEYIHFNAYGNLETTDELTLADIATDAMSDIYDHPEVWGAYFTLPENEDEAEDEADED